MAKNIQRLGGYTPGQRANDLQTVVSLLASAAVLLEGRLELDPLADQVAALRDEAVVLRDEQQALVEQLAAQVTRDALAAQAKKEEEEEGS